MDRKKVARIFKASRKSHRIGQIKLANDLGITQGTVSKIEKGILSVDVALWYKFCGIFQLDADQTFSSGFVYFKDSDQEKKVMEEFKRKGRERKYIEARRLLPLWNSLVESGFQKEINELAKSHKVDPDLFVLPSFPIPMKFFVEIFEFVNQQTAKSDLVNASVKKFIQHDIYSLKDKAVSFTSYAKRLEKDEGLLHYQYKKNTLEASLDPNIQPTPRDISFLETYFDYEARCLKKLWEKQFGAEKIKLSKKNSGFHFLLEKVA